MKITLICTSCQTAADFKPVLTLLLTYINIFLAIWLQQKQAVNRALTYHIIAAYYEQGKLKKNKEKKEEEEKNNNSEMLGRAEGNCKPGGNYSMHHDVYDIQIL